MKRIFYLLSIILLLIGLPLSAQETTKRIEPNSGHSVLDDYAGWEEDGGVYYGHGIPYECDWTCEVIGVTPEATDIKIISKVYYGTSSKYGFVTTGIGANGLHLVDGSVSNVKSVKILVSLKDISNNAFSGLPIEKIEIPESCSYIGTCAFKGCSSLKYIDCGAKIPPTAWKSTFEGVPVDECELVVPDESLELYHQSEIWGVFKHIRGKYFFIGIDEVTDGNSEPEIRFDGGVLISEKEGLPVAVYSVDGRCVASRTLAQGESLELPGHGIYIIVADGKSKKIIY